MKWIIPENSRRLVRTSKLDLWRIDSSSRRLSMENGLRLYDSAAGRHGKNGENRSSSLYLLLLAVVDMGLNLKMLG